MKLLLLFCLLPMFVSNTAATQVPEIPALPDDSTGANSNEVDLGLIFENIVDRLDLLAENQLIINEKLDRKLDNHSYVGCYFDKEERDLPYHTENSQLTPRSCVKRCFSLGYPYAGVQSRYDLSFS